MLPTVDNCIVLNLLYQLNVTNGRQLYYIEPLYQLNVTNGRQLYYIEPTVSVERYQWSTTVLY